MGRCYPVAMAGPFRFEREMTQGLEAELPHALSIPADRPYFFLREPHLWGIIPDFLIGYYRTPKGFEARPGVSLIDSFILAELEGSAAVTAEDVATQIFLTTSETEIRLRKLAKRELVRVSPRGSWEIVPRFNSRCLEIVAVEAKVRRWREAFAQALSYLAFANRAYVALAAPITAMDRDVLGLFRSSGVGLLHQSYGQVSIIIPASRHNPTSPARVRAADILTNCPPRCRLELTWVSPQSTARAP